MSEQPTSQPKPQTKVEFSFEEPQFDPQHLTPTLIENIIGSLPRVTTAPTWTPRNFSSSIVLYVSGGVYRVYFYYFSDNTWHYALLV